jgi:hypothetical protein
MSRSPSPVEQVLTIDRIISEHGIAIRSVFSPSESAGFLCAYLSLFRCLLLVA